VKRKDQLKELKDASDAELSQKLAESKEESFRLRFQLTTNQLDNPMKMRDARRRAARILTEQQQRATRVAAGAKA